MSGVRFMFRPILPGAYQTSPSPADGFRSLTRERSPTKLCGARWIRREDATFQAQDAHGLPRSRMDALRRS